MVVSQNHGMHGDDDHGKHVGMGKHGLLLDHGYRCIERGVLYTQPILGRGETQPIFPCYGLNNTVGNAGLYAWSCTPPCG